MDNKDASRLTDSSMGDSEWQRFLNYMEHEVRPQCKPQRETLAGGPFQWLQTLSGKSFGEKVAPLIVRFFLEDELEPREHSDHDFVFRGRKVELKTGTEHSTEGVFLFQQIRPQQDWDLLLCLGLCVRSLVFFVLTRSFVEAAIETWRSDESSIITPQHGGARDLDRTTAEPDTFWMWTRPEWESLLEDRRSEFDAEGWRGSPIRESLVP